MARVRKMAYRRAAPEVEAVDERCDAVILGAGLTGLSCALHHVGRSQLLEKERSVGGKARSDRRDGFTFDITGHWLHLRDPRTKALVADLFAPGDLVEIERRTGVFTHGVMLPYPFQANLFGLPLDVVHECLIGLFEAGRRTDTLPPDASLQAFAEHRFGAGIARHFFVPYNTKLWGVAPDRLTSAWVTRYVPVPDPSQIIAGAIGMRQEGLGYNAHFSYPVAGGIDALAEALRARLSKRDDVDISLDAGATAIDAIARVVQLANGRRVGFEKLVSSIPLPDLVDRLVDAPPEIIRARAALQSMPWRYLNVATRTPTPRDEHWIYVPEDRFPFFRVGIFTNALPAMAPPGCGGLYVELTDRVTPPDLPAILAGLVEIGAITHVDDVLFTEIHDIEHAYVVFDDEHAAATETILSWLAAHGIRSCGRYGAWVYSSMEDALLDGMEAAQWLKT